MAKKATKQGGFKATTELESLGVIRALIVEKKAHIAAVLAAIERAEESVTEVDEQAQDVKRLREQYEDLIAAREVGGNVNDEELEALRMELADASENSASIMAQYQKNAGEKRAMLAGLNRKLKTLEAELTQLEEQEHERLIDFLEAEVLAENKDYIKIVGEFDRVFSKLLGINVWLGEFYSAAQIKVNTGTRAEGLRFPKVAHSLLSNQRNMVAIPGFVLDNDEQPIDTSSLESLRFRDYTVLSGIGFPDSFNFDIEKTQGGQVPAERIKAELDRITGAGDE